MKILIADKFAESGLEQLRGLASELRYDASLKGDALRATVAEFDPELLIVRSTKVPAEVIEAGEHLTGIIRAGSGYDTIDVAAASRRGGMVANCPGMNAAAVAELTIGLMIALDRQIPDNVLALRNRQWKKKYFAKAAFGLRGRTLGIVGAGQIGSRVARAALGLEMKVLYYHLGRQRRLADLPNCERAELDDLLRRSDVVSIHLPGGPSTHHLIDERRIGLMKPTALLINTSRAGIVDEQALAKALKEGRLRGAALDVWPDEPPADAETFDTPLADVPNLYGTHHIGASTQEAQDAVAAETVRLVRHFRQTGVLPNCVNMQAEPRTRCMLIVRMRNRPGSLAHVFQAISEAGINAEEMDHIVYDGGEAACAHIRIDREPEEPVLRRIREGHENILGVELLSVD